MIRMVENVEVTFQEETRANYLETVCYVESVFMVTLLEGTMTTAVNDMAHLGPQMATSSLQNVASALPSCEPGVGVRVNCSVLRAETPTVI